MRGKNPASATGARAYLNASNALMSAGEEMSAGTPPPRGAIAPAGREVAPNRAPSLWSRRVGTRQSHSTAGSAGSRDRDSQTRRRSGGESPRRFRMASSPRRITKAEIGQRRRKSASLASFSLPQTSVAHPRERDGDRLGVRGGVRVFPRGDRDAAPAADARARGAVDEVRGAKSGAANVAGSERARVPPLRRQGRVVASAPAATRVPGPTGALRVVVSRRRRENRGGGREKNRPRGASRRRGGAPRDARRSGAHPLLPHADFPVNPPLVPLRPHLLAVRHDGVSYVRAREGVCVNCVAHPAV